MVRQRGRRFAGISIDGHHTHPHPLHDAQNALKVLADPGVIFLHDYNLRDVQIAYDWLKQQPGMKSKTFETMWGIAVCWRGIDDIGSP